MFDPIAYWQHRGEQYESRFHGSDQYAAQELRIAALAESLRPSSVLEVGCGFGRITQIISPHVGRYVAIDVSQHQIAAAEAKTVNVEYHQVALQDFRSDESFDLVLAVEVLMHIPPTQIVDAINRLCGLSSRYVLICDWAFPIERHVAEHNWLHPYADLFVAALDHAAMQFERIDHQLLLLIDKGA